jgi:hypothetical protein
VTQVYWRWPGILMLSVALGPAGAAERQAPAGQAARPPAARVNVDVLGPKVGERLPDFGLRDQHGNEQSLKSLIGPKGAIVVFFRSADW